MAIYEIDGISPELGDGAWVADSAEVIGRVHLGKNANVWPQVVIRGDNEPIRIVLVPIFKMQQFCTPILARH